MKRFMLFAGDWYYPSGGMNDFKGSFDTLEEAEAWVKSRQERYSIDWINLFDTQLGVVVAPRFGHIGSEWVCSQPAEVF